LGFLIVVLFGSDTTGESKLGMASFYGDATSIFVSQWPLAHLIVLLSLCGIASY